MPDTVVSINTSFSEPQLTDIRTCWEMVREGVSFILEEDPQLTFLAEDIYSECVNNRAMLFTSSIGFVVLTVEIDQFTQNKSLLVWIAYTFEKGKHNWMDHAEWFEKTATTCECKFIEARSSVSQLETYFLHTGWDLNTKVFIREVKKDGR